MNESNQHRRTVKSAALGAIPAFTQSKEIRIEETTV
jgi:hypothetical protein